MFALVPENIYVQEILFISVYLVTYTEIGQDFLDKQLCANSVFICNNMISCSKCRRTRYIFRVLGSVLRRAAFVAVFSKKIQRTESGNHCTLIAVTLWTPRPPFFISKALSVGYIVSGEHAKKLMGGGGLKVQQNNRGSFEGGPPKTMDITSYPYLTSADHGCLFIVPDTQQIHGGSFGKLEVPPGTWTPLHT